MSYICTLNKYVKWCGILLNEKERTNGSTTCQIVKAK